MKHPWALISQIDFRIMSFYVFTNVFQKFGLRGSNLVHLNLILNLELKSGISRFWLSARAEEVPLERGNRASSTLHCSSVRSSGLMYARAEDWVTRSSGEVDARAGPFVCMAARAGKPALERDSVFTEISETVFCAHLCILIPF